MKKFLTVFLSVILVWSVIPLSAISVYTQTSGDYTYAVKDGKAYIEEYTGPGGDITIPSQLGGYPVCEIGDEAFNAHQNLTGVTIPDGVISIGNLAFGSCTSLKRVKIPNSVTSIGVDAFGYCYNLTNITIPEGVVSIKDRAFWGTGLTSITIPSSVAYIGDDAFRSCLDLVSVTISKGVTHIGFRMFDGCYKLTSVTIPDSVTNIGSSAFSGCKSLTTITIPNSVTVIGTYAFQNCNLTSITIPNSVTTIEYGAFELCGNLRSVTIPSSVKSIGSGAFRYCHDNLTFRVAEGSYAHQYALNNNINTYLTWVAAPAAPVIQNFSTYSVTLEVHDGYEYRSEGGNWQTGNTIYGLSAGTKYAFYQRVAGTSNSVSGESSEATYCYTLPAAPILESKTDTSVALIPIAGYEYSRDGVKWQTSNVFTGLSPATEYTFYQRIAEVAKVYPNAFSDAARITTDKRTTDAPSAPKVIQRTTSSVTLEKKTGYEYSIDGKNWTTNNVFSSLSEGSTYTFYQRIAATETANASPSSPGVTVKIKHDVTAPNSAPVVSTSTATSVTLKKTAGYEYKCNDGSWQTGNVFTDLKPNVEYKFYQRIAETEDYYESDASPFRKLTIKSVGDLNNDKEITDWDGVLLARYLAGWNEKVDTSVLDIDGDGEITDWDAVIFDRYLAGWNVNSAIGTGKPIITYYITYEDTKGVNHNNISEYEGGSFPLSDISAQYYNFDGWYCNGKKVTTISEITEDTVITAKWTAIQYTITYQGAKGGNPNKTVYTADSPAYLFDLDDAGSEYFEGWYDSNGNKVTTVRAGMGDITLTARYAPIVTPTIYKNSNNPIGTYTVTYKYVGKGLYDITFSFTIINNTGAQFVGYGIYINGEQKGGAGVASSFGKTHNVNTTVRGVPGGIWNIYLDVQI